VAARDDLHTVPTGRKGAASPRSRRCEVASGAALTLSIARRDRHADSSFKSTLLKRPVDGWWPEAGLGMKRNGLAFGAIGPAAHGRRLPERLLGVPRCFIIRNCS
jgi:hypothetical protein